MQEKIITDKTISGFLREVGIKIQSLKEAKRLYGNQVAPDFHIFDYLRDDEMGLSRCIGNLLDPNGKHGQGDVFLKEFLKILNNLINENILITSQADETNEALKEASIKWDALNAKDCRISLEQVIDNLRRVDITLKFGCGALIGIENKPWADDQKNQLLDYANFLAKSAGSNPWTLVYLCNTEPSKTSIPNELSLNLIENGNLIRINYDEIIDWLRICASHAKAPVVRVFIEELSKYIRKEINGEVEMSVSSAVQNIILHEDNLEAAMLVSKTIDNVKRELIAKLKSELINATQSNGYKLQWKESMNSKWSGYSGFGVNFNNLQQFDFELWFEFWQPNLKSFHWGIRRRDGSVTNSTDHWASINNIMSLKFGLGKQNSWWSWAAEYEVDNNFKNWENSSEPWLAIKNGSFAKEIINLCHQVHQLFIESNQLGLLKVDDK